MLIRSALLTAAVGLLASTAAQAQTGNGSDVSGPTTTSSSIAGGTFAPSPGTVAANASPAVSAAVQTAGAAVTSQLGAGTLTATTPSGQVVAIPAAVQAAVAAILTGAASPTQVAQMVDALSAAGSAAPQLVEALAGLLQGDGGTGQLAAAVGIYNQMVANAPPGFLANPPAAFSAVQSVLSTLVVAAGAAR